MSATATQQSSEQAERKHGAIVDVIGHKGYGFAVMSGGKKVFVHQSNFRNRNGVAFSGEQLAQDPKRKLVRRGMLLSFIVGPVPEGKNMPEALDVVVAG